MKNEFVADGFRRWAAGRDAKMRANFPAKFAGENQPQSFFGKMRGWFERELVVLRHRDHGEKSPPKILW